jgi:hypothetical protein
VLHKKHENRGSRRRATGLNFHWNINVLIGEPRSIRWIRREPMILHTVAYPLRTRRRQDVPRPNRSILFDAPRTPARLLLLVATRGARARPRHPSKYRRREGALTNT